MSSEFGRGYATCLLQFANHRGRLISETDSVETWANGSSDHLAELKRPRRGVGREEWRRADALATRMLNVGHGFRESSHSDWAEVGSLLDEADALLALLTARGHATDTLDEAMATDLALGLRPDRGSWACPADLPARKAASNV